MRKFLHEAYPEIFAQLIRRDSDGISDYKRLTTKNARKLLWKCDKGHEWETRVSHRTSGSGCPYCAGVRLVSGKSPKSQENPRPRNLQPNDFESLRPDLIRFWDFERNTNCSPSQISATSAMKVWWKCDKGHSTTTSVKAKADRKKGFYCSECLRETRVFLKDHPLSEELDAERNTLLSCGEVGIQSPSKLWWKCDKGHSWEASVKNRFYGRGCPACAYEVGTYWKRIEKPLAETHPGVLSLWDAEENEKHGLDPSVLTAGSRLKAHWKCSKEHTWTARVSKMKDSHAERFACPVCSNRVIIAGVNDFLTTHSHLATLTVVASDSDVLLGPGSNELLTFKCDKGHVFKSRVSDQTRKHRRGCPMCSSSQGQRDIALWLNSLGVSTILNDRSRIRPKEIDILLPELNIAIEYNGLYWHSDENPAITKNTHADKFELCRDAGLELVYVWEDDWTYRQEIVKESILRRLGISQQVKISARKTKVEHNPSLNEVREFLESNHIQGYSQHSRAFGLRDDSGELRAVMTFASSGKTKHRSGEVELVLSRYATDCVLRGGFSKLLKHAEVVLGREKGCTSIASFADIGWTSGSMYELNGFTTDKVLPPDYRYVIGSKRYHKFLFRKERFRKSSELLFDESLTEQELAHWNGIHRTWDCGKVRYVKKLA